MACDRRFKSDIAGEAAMARDRRFKSDIPGEAAMARDRRFKSDIPGEAAMARDRRFKSDIAGEAEMARDRRFRSDMAGEAATARDRRFRSDMAGEAAMARDRRFRSDMAGEAAMARDRRFRSDLAGELAVDFIDSDNGRLWHVSKTIGSSCYRLKGRTLIDSTLLANIPEYQLSSRQIADFRQSQAGYVMVSPASSFSSPQAKDECDIANVFSKQSPQYQGSHPPWATPDALARW